MSGLCPENSLSTAWPFATKPGMVEHQHELVCYARREKACCQDHCENFKYNQNITISAISSELMILLKLNLV